MRQKCIIDQKGIGNWQVHIGRTQSLNKSKDLQQLKGGEDG
jgi:hypothetical protein